MAAEASRRLGSLYGEMPWFGAIVYQVYTKGRAGVASRAQDPKPENEERYSITDATRLCPRALVGSQA
jgi:hypothetical protein